MEQGFVQSAPSDSGAQCCQLLYLFFKGSGKSPVMAGQGDFTQICVPIVLLVALSSVCSLRNCIAELHEFFYRFTLGHGQRVLGALVMLTKVIRDLIICMNASFLIYKEKYSCRADEILGQPGPEPWCSVGESGKLFSYRSGWLVDHLHGGALLQHGSWMTERPRHTFTCPVLQKNTDRLYALAPLSPCGPPYLCYAIATDGYD